MDQCNPKLLSLAGIGAALDRCVRNVFLPFSNALISRSPASTSLHMSRLAIFNLLDDSLPRIALRQGRSVLYVLEDTDSPDVTPSCATPRASSGV